MADKAELLQAIDDAILDADSLERFINGSEDETVLTRLSAEYPTLQKALKELFENGGIAGRFKTLVQLQVEGVDLSDGSYALVADDADDKNGIYIKEAGSWVKSKSSFIGRGEIADMAKILFADSAVQDTPNMTVRRYLVGGNEITDYPSGTYQSLSGGAVKVAVTAAGSGDTAHYLKTKISGHDNARLEFKILKTGDYDAVGFGFDDNNNYKGYTYSKTGTLRKLTGSIAEVITTGLLGFNVSDLIVFDVNGNSLKIQVNGAVVFNGVVDAALDNMPLLIAQTGFAEYEAKVSSSSSPIADYVDSKVFQYMGLSRSNYYKVELNKVVAFTRVAGSLFVGFDISHEVDSSDTVYVDYWRIAKADFYTFDGESMQPTGKKALGLGESEFVFKQDSTRVDFTGGYHGDEKIVSVTFLADGLPVDVGSSTPLTPCNSFKYIANSTMHETAITGSEPFIAGHPIVAYHSKVTEFLNGGYRTYNRVKWNYSGVMSTLYHGISCIAKDTATTVIAGDNYLSQSMTGSGNNYFEASRAREYFAYNAGNKLAVKATSRVMNNEQPDNNSTFFVHDRAADSKYYRKSPYKNVSIGDVDEFEFSCFFSAK